MTNTIRKTNSTMYILRNPSICNTVCNVPDRQQKARWIDKRINVSFNWRDFYNKEKDLLNTASKTGSTKALNQSQKFAKASCFIYDMCIVKGCPMYPNTLYSHTHACIHMLYRTGVSLAGHTN